MDCEGCLNSYFSFIGLCTRVDHLISFLQAHHVLLRHVDCPRCKKPCPLRRYGNSIRFRCRLMSTFNKKKKTRCNFSVSGKAGTFLDRSCLDITTICQFLCHWLLTPYPRQRFLIQELHMSSSSVVHWSNVCRQVCINYLTRNSVVLGGEGATVEIDEANIGKGKYNRGRKIKGQWIFGGFERGTKKVFIVPVPHRTSATLLQVIRDYILPGTTIISDCWRAYNCLNEEGFRHLTVNHSLTFVDSVTGAHTQNIERLWRDVRGGIPRYGRKEGHMIGYLAEFMFKRSVDRTKLIHEFMRAAATLYPPSVPIIGEDAPDEARPGPSTAQ